MNNSASKYRTVDVASITRDIVRQWWAILLFSLSIALLTNVVSNILYTPEYTSSTTFVVTTRGTNSSIYQDISNASDTAVRFQTILNSNILKRTIEKDLNIKKFNATCGILPKICKK